MPQSLAHAHTHTAREIEVYWCLNKNQLTMIRSQPVKRIFSWLLTYWMAQNSIAHLIILCGFCILLRLQRDIYIYIFIYCDDFIYTGSMSTSFRSHILNQHMNNEQTTHWTGCTAPVLFSTFKTCCYLQTNHSNEQPQRIRIFAVIVCKCVIVWFAVIRWRLSNTGMVLCVWTSSGARKSTQHTHMNQCWTKAKASD